MILFSGLLNFLGSKYLPAVGTAWRTLPCPIPPLIFYGICWVTSKIRHMQVFSLVWLSPETHTELTFRFLGTEFFNSLSLYCVHKLLFLSQELSCIYCEYIMFLPILPVPLLLLSVLNVCKHFLLFDHISFKLIHCTERTPLTNYLKVQMWLLLPDFIINFDTCVSTTWIQHLLICCHICFILVYMDIIIHIFLYIWCALPWIIWML